MQSIEPEIYRCIESISHEQHADGSIKAKALCSFPPSFIGFNGHFSGNPVLPAVVQLAVVRLIVEKITGTDLLPEELSRTKFRSMVMPEQQLVITVTMSQEEDSWKGKFGIKTEKKEQVAAGNFRFRPNLEQ